MLLHRFAACANPFAPRLVRAPVGVADIYGKTFFIFASFPVKVVAKSRSLRALNGCALRYQYEYGWAFGQNTKPDTSHLFALWAGMGLFEAHLFSWQDGMTLIGG